MFEGQCGLTGEEQEMRSMSGCAQVPEGNHSASVQVDSPAFSAFPDSLSHRKSPNPPLPALKEGTYKRLSAFSYDPHLLLKLSH